MGPEDKLFTSVGKPAWASASARAGAGSNVNRTPGTANFTNAASAANAVNTPSTGAYNFGDAMSQAWPVDSRPVLVAAVLPPAEEARPPVAATRTVAAGDTLTSLVKAQAQAQGVPLSGPQVMRLAHLVASDNKIANANRIFIGQQLTMSGLNAEIESSRKAQSVASPVLAKLAPAATVLQALAASPANTPNMPNTQAAQIGQNWGRSFAKAQAVAALAQPVTQRHEVLDKTLSRAVAKGFIPANEKGDVRDKILALAKNHRFNPDDFARMTLMESDGMNPKATNQRCHGIIQFCDGSDRGAASAGYAANPKAILGLSVYQQLHLVDKYFDEVGLKNKGPAGLDDLYLSVLMPSARSETRSDAPLAVNSSQAKALYEGRDSSAPMTRQSILQGLLKNAADRLGQVASPVSGRLQALRTALVAVPAKRRSDPGRRLRGRRQPRGRRGDSPAPGDGEFFAARHAHWRTRNQHPRQPAPPDGELKTR